MNASKGKADWRDLYLFVCLSVNKAAVAVWTFNPTVLCRNLKPDTGMALSALTTVTGHAPYVDNLGLRSCLGHIGPSMVVAGPCPL